jgi:predicted MFS family arabinose efflux permease
MSLHQTSVYFGIVSSAAMAGYIGQHYGWRSAFLLFGGIGILAALVLAAGLREPVRGQSDREDAAFALSGAQPGLAARLIETFHSPTAIILMLAFVGMNFVNVACLTWMPTLLFQKFEYSLAAASFHATFYHQLGAFAGVIAGGKLADRWALRMRLSRPLTQAAGLLLGAPFIFLLGWSPSTHIVFVSLALFGVFRGMYDSNLFASLYEVVRPEARATATGIMLAVAFLAGGSAALVTGWLSQRIGLGPALASASLWYLAGGLIILLDCWIWFRRDAARMQRAEFAT